MGGLGNSKGETGKGRLYWLYWQQERMSTGETREDGVELKPQHYPTQGAIESGYLYTSSYHSWVESCAQEPLSIPGTFSLLSAAGHRNGNCQQDTGQSRAAGCGCYTHIKRFTVLRGRVTIRKQPDTCNDRGMLGTQRSP